MVHYFADDPTCRDVRSTKKRSLLTQYWIRLNFPRRPRTPQVADQWTTTRSLREIWISNCINHVVMFYYSKIRTMDRLVGCLCTIMVSRFQSRLVFVPRGCLRSARVGCWCVARPVCHLTWTFVSNAQYATFLTWNIRSITAALQQFIDNTTKLLRRNWKILEEKIVDLFRKNKCTYNSFQC